MTAAAFAAYCRKDITKLVSKLLVLPQPSFHSHTKIVNKMLMAELPARIGMVDTGCRSAVGGKSFYSEEVKKLQMADAPRHCPGFFGSDDIAAWGMMLGTSH